MRAIVGPEDISRMTVTMEAYPAAIGSGTKCHLDHILQFPGQLEIALFLLDRYEIIRHEEVRTLPPHLNG